MFLVDLSAAADHFLVKIDQLRCQLLTARRHGDRLVDAVICADDPAVFVSSHKLFHQKKHPLHRFFIVIQMLSIVHAVITRNSGLACRCRMEIYDSINLIRLTPVENIIQHGKGIFIIRNPRLLIQKASCADRQTHGIVTASGEKCNILLRQIQPSPAFPELLRIFRSAGLP